MRRYGILLIVLSLSVRLMAQYDAAFSHYWAMEPSFNPATVGKEVKLNAVAVYAIQLAGFDHHPNTMYASVDMPIYIFGTHHGVGVQLLNDAIGLFTHKRVALQYAWQSRMWGGTFSLGAQAGMLSEHFDGSRLDLDDADDPAFASSSVDGSSVDVGIGAYYRCHDWYVGVSAMHLNSPQVDLGETNELDISPTYYLSGGYNIRLSHPFLSIHTSLLGRTDGVDWRADISGRLMYTHEKRVMYAGLSYSPTRSVTLQLGGDIRGIRVGYSYEVYTSAISFIHGSHELFIGYQTELDLFKKGRNLHKSVRFL